MCIISRQILFQTLTYHGLFQNKGNLNLISILRIHLCNVDFRSALMHMLHVCLITYKVTSENGYGFLRPGLKTGVGNGIFGSEIGSGFGDVGGTPPPNIPRSTPLGPIYVY